ncbi:acyl-CoA dehydrogenase [Lysinibacillus yapensis]|uniref:Acyl-CoA dehydrogenase n=1 Tax=Ureibacillus yapensis TaxID=2304605 RepID=A0A396SBJ5_9BACL|nr:acyl-CoA dehydrogenase family protein [Lysinibacillus yapensis]RHW38400.1 acyl-CoA dehydrogenase [Lysinibacillus yapensis]
MSEMKEMILEVVEKMFKKTVDKETVDLAENGHWAESVWQILKDNEILNVAVSESAGGAGGDIDDLLSLYQLVGKYAVPIPFTETTLSNYILESYQLAISNDSITYCLPQTSLVMNDDQTISGTLINVPWARHVKEILAFAHSSEGVFPVRLSLKEATIHPNTNLAGESRDTVTFNQSKSLQVQSTPLSDDQLQDLNTIDTAAKNALMCGAIEKAFLLSVQFAKEREQFGRPIHRFQLVQQHLALLAGEQAIASSSLENMIAALLEGREQNEVAYTRIRLDEASRIVSTSAHQVHAAIGVTHEHSLHQYTRRLWSWREEGLTANHWKKVVANTLLTTPFDDLWSYLTDSEKIFTTN